MRSVSLRGDTERGQRGTGGHGDDDVGQVIFVQFGDGPKISRSEWLAGSLRCETEARRQPEKIAETLRRCAERYRQRAEGF